MWLCRTEGFVAYVYGTHVGIAADSASALTEGIDIYVSSDRYDASKSLGIVSLAGGTIKIVEHNLAVMPASRETEFSLVCNAQRVRFRRTTKSYSAISGEMRGRAHYGAKVR